MLVSATIQDECVKSAVDSAALGNYFPIDCNGEAHTQGGTPHMVGTANNGHMACVASNGFILLGLPTAAQKCEKFWKVTLPLVLVGTLCVNRLTVTFDVNGVTTVDETEKVVAEGCRDPSVTFASFASNGTPLAALLIFQGWTNFQGSILRQQQLVPADFQGWKN